MSCVDLHLHAGDHRGAPKGSVEGIEVHVRTKTEIGFDQSGDGQGSRLALTFEWGQLNRIAWADAEEVGQGPADKQSVARKLDRL